MPTPIHTLHTAYQQGDLNAVAETLSKLVQHQHAASLLLPSGKRQFGYCCQQLAKSFARSGDYLSLLLAAEVCFNHAYTIPNQKLASPCPHHPRPTSA
jgi:hypothetical protein